MSPRQGRRKGRQRRTVALPGDPSDPASFHVAVSDWLDWLEVHDYSPVTVMSHSWHLQRFMSWAELRGITRPHDVTLPVLESYQRHVSLLRKPNGMALSWSSQHQALVPLRSFFAWCAKSHRILYNPASELSLARTEHRLPKATLTHEEAEAVLCLPDTGTPIGLRDRAMLEVLYATAVRRGELVSLDLVDTDLSRRFITLRETKTRRDRAVPLGERAAAWLGHYLNDARPSLVIGADPGAVFLATNGERIGVKWLSSQVHHYVEAAGVGKTGSCHLFRHSAATLMLEGGADVRYVQELLGHRSLDATQIYTRVAPERLAAIHAATHPGARLPGKDGS